jgi:phosphatidylserine decarboxylase
VPIASDGWRFIIPLLIGGLGLWFLGGRWGTSFAILCWTLSAFCAFFFRDPHRATPADPSLIYSPADGRVTEVATMPAGEIAGWRVIRIFLSVFDGHVQRSPVAGNVEAVVYRKGSFLDARDGSAHLENEQNAITLSSPQGRVIVTQIAGLIARRIVCWVSVGDRLNQGEHLGLIRFGSQVNLFLPPSADAVVQVGDRVKGGWTVVATWSV